RTMFQRRHGAMLIIVLGCVAVMVTAAASPARTSGGPSWGGPKTLTTGVHDGFGGNSWRLVTTASARNEAAKCPSVESLSYADGQGNRQKAVSEIQGMVGQGD